MRFLVFDELHTYRGRQGADVAMLIRRLKERCAAPDLVCVGTSATMVASREATPLQRRETVADFASQVFGRAITQDRPSKKRLNLSRRAARPHARNCAASSHRAMPAALPEFRPHPLARWSEGEFGVEPEEGGRCVVASPGLSRMPPPDLRRRRARPRKSAGSSLRELLTRGGDLARDDGGRAFAFKLHQFIGQGRAVYSTLEPAATRQFSLEGQAFAGPGRFFVPIKFCRHAVRITTTSSVPATAPDSCRIPLGTDTIEDGDQAGYLMLAPLSKTTGARTAFPTNGETSEAASNPLGATACPRPSGSAPTATPSPCPAPGQSKCGGSQRRFPLPELRRVLHRRELEFAKLASLSSEARTSATTVLATSLLRRAAGTAGARDKLLTFTDNRQDASLQAGHFNDFIHVSLLRSALHAALLRDNELTFERVADAVVRTSGLTTREVARNPELDPESPAAADVLRAFTELTEYRLYEDLRRGWRVVQPNLENVGLLRVGYRGLETLCADDARWRFHPSVATVAAAQRERLVRALLDQFRRKLAIACRCLEETNQQQIRRRAEQHLNEFWGLDESAPELRTANRFVREGQSQRLAEGFSLGARSKLGRFLASELDLDPPDYDTFIDGLLAMLGRPGPSPPPGPAGRPPILPT